MPLPACEMREALPGFEGAFHCAHPRVHVAGQVVSAEICRQCVQAAAPTAARRPFDVRSNWRQAAQAWTTVDWNDTRGGPS